MDYFSSALRKASIARPGVPVVIDLSYVTLADFSTAYVRYSFDYSCSPVNFLLSNAELWPRDEIDQGAQRFPGDRHSSAAASVESPARSQTNVCSQLRLFCHRPNYQE